MPILGHKVSFEYTLIVHIKTVSLGWFFDFWNVSFFIVTLMGKEEQIENRIYKM